MKDIVWGVGICWIYDWPCLASTTSIFQSGSRRLLIHNPFAVDRVTKNLDETKSVVNMGNTMSRVSAHQVCDYPTVASASHVPQRLTSTSRIRLAFAYKFNHSSRSCYRQLRHYSLNARINLDSAPWLEYLAWTILADLYPIPRYDPAPQSKYFIGNSTLSQIWLTSYRNHCESVTL